MNRDRWQRWLTYLSWICPACQSGSLMVLPDSRLEVMSRSERLDRNDPSSDPDQSLMRFTAHLQCNNKACAETATAMGNHFTHWLPDGTEHGYVDEGFEVLSIVPAPLPFVLAKKVPKPIEDIIREASRLFWLDHKAAANRAREAIDAILTDLGVPTAGPRGNALRLHDRIQAFAKLDGGKWSEQAEIIEAAKWIGNEGTHGTITRDDALDAFEMLETVIDDIYVRTRHAMLAKVRTTNAKYRAR